MTETDYGILYHLLAQCFKYLTGYFVESLKSLIGELSIDLWQPTAPSEKLLPLPAFFQELANLDRQDPKVLHQEYVRLFASEAASPSCSLHERSYCSGTGKELVSQSVRDAYALWGLKVSPARADRLDVELEFMAYLCGQAGDHGMPVAACVARRHFCREHLASWVPYLVVAIGAHAQHGFYVLTGELLERVIQFEMDDGMPLLGNSGYSRVLPADGWIPSG